MSLVIPFSLTPTEAYMGGKKDALKEVKKTIDKRIMKLKDNIKDFKLVSHKYQVYARINELKELK